MFANRCILLGLIMALAGVARADIRITEYYYQNGEYVELTNVGVSPIDMTGWSFDDDTNVPGSVDLSAFGVVAAGESVIITEAAEAAFRTDWSLAPAVKIVGGSGLLAGLQRNDTLNIWNASNVLIDRLAYGDQTFPGSIRAQNPSGWVCAEGLGADDPYLWFLSAVADSQNSFTSIAGVVGSPGIFVSVTCPAPPIGACCALGNCTEETEDDCTGFGGEYQGDLSTCGGVTCPAPPSTGIRITEYMYQGPDGEFVELTNTSGASIDMTGWSLDDNTNLPGSVSLSAFGMVAAGESVVVTESVEATFRTQWGLAPGVKIIGGSGALAGFGRNDTINVWDGSSALIDRLDYGDQTYPGSIRTQNPSGWVCAEAIGANDPQEWFYSVIGDAQGSTSSVGGAVGSPGSFTSVPCASIVTLASTVPAQQSGVAALPSVSVTFSTPVNGVVAGNLTVNGSAATNVSGSGAGPYLFDGYAIPAAGSVNIALASNTIVSQVGGFPFDGESWTLSVGILIVINEVHYHPHDTLYPNQEVEFFELINAGSASVDVSGWSMESGLTLTLPALPPLAPGAYLVLATNPTALEAATGYVGAIQWSAGALSNGGERLAIADTSGNVVDDITYSDSGDWPNAADGDGPSMELLNPGYPNEYGPAWRASLAINGTPGAQNSVFSPVVAPIIVDTHHVPAIPAPLQAVTVTARVVDDSPNPTVTLHYRQDADPTIAYSSVIMLDDGLSGDGAAGDGTYGASMPGLANGARMDFTIRADDGSNSSAAPPGHNTLIAGEYPGQTYLCKYSNAVPASDLITYHLITTQRTASLQVAHDETEYDGTFLQCDLAGNCEVFYNIVERYRGQSSLGQHPHSFRVNFSSNQLLQSEMGFPISRLNLMSQSVDKMGLGYQFFGLAFGGSIPTPKSQYVRFNTNPLSHGGIQDHVYLNVERIDEDFLESEGGLVTPPRFPSLCSVSATACESDANCPGGETCLATSDGNLYRGRLTGNLDYRGEAQTAYSASGYDKETNIEVNDWADIVDISRALDATQTPNAAFESTVSNLVDEIEWARWFAIHMLLVNQEGGIYRDTGDDYYLYFEPTFSPLGYNAKFLPWDMDSVFGGFGGAFNQETIWRTTVAGPQRFVRSNAFAGRFVNAICELLATDFSQATMDARIDALPDAAANAARKTALKNWVAARHVFVNNEIIDALTLTGIPASPYTNSNPNLAISGQLNQCGTHSIEVNGEPADAYSVFAGTWSHSVALWPGINKITVKAFDHAGAEIGSVANNVNYDPAPAAPGLRLTAPNRMVDSKTLTLKAEILDANSNIEWRQCGQVGTVSAIRLSDGSPVPTSVTIFETLPEGAGAGGPAPDTIRFYNGVGSVSITLDQGAATPPGDILVTVSLGAFSASRIVEVLDGDNPSLYRNLSGTLSGADLTWSPSDGVIHLTGTVTVSSGVLNILPDTIVMVDAGPANNGVAIVAQGGGTISAIGTHAQPIFFFPTNGPAAMSLPQNAQNNNSSWRGMYHLNGGTSNYSYVFVTGAGNAIVSSHPRPPIMSFANSHSAVVQDSVLADCPGMGTSSVGGANGSYTFRRCLFSRVGIGGEWLGTNSTLLIEDSWFTRIGRAPEPNGVDGDIFHMDRTGNSYIVRRSVMSDTGDDVIDHSTGAQPIIENCIIYDARDKVVSLDGSAGATVTMTNTLMFSAPGGIRCSGGEVFLTNCTLGSNTNVNGQACTSSIQNSILWTNSADTCCGAVDHTIVGNSGHLGCGVGNLSVNPQFVSTSCNYNLQVSSPGLTAGPGGTQIGWLGFPFPAGCQFDTDCDDGNACTIDDCTSGICSNTPIPGCVPCDTVAECNDSNACTTDACTGGQCQNTVIPGCTPCSVAGDCDDSNLCTTDTCPAGACVITPVSCPPGQTCNPANGFCETGPTMVMFQNGFGGYSNTVDTYIDAALGSQATASPIVVDSSPLQQVLVRFDNIFGGGVGQIPPGSTVTSATLTLWSGAAANDQSANPVDIHELLNPWVDTGVWGNYGVVPWNTTAGLQADGVDALTTTTATFSITTVATSSEIDVTSSLQAWSGNPAANFGWVLLPTGTDGLRLESSESITASNSRRPKLTVLYVSGGCVTNGDCDDGNVCTDDVCNVDVCEYTSNANSCDDGDLCTMVDVCLGGACAGTPVSCPPGGTCNPANGQCEFDPAVLNFQDGTNGYADTLDTFLHAGSATANNSLAVTLIVDGTPPVADERQTLLRFDNIFGNGAGQIPLGSTIQSATLTIQITNASLDGADFHRMLQSWSDVDNWNTWAGGIQANDIEALATADASSFLNTTGSHAVTVTSSVAAWSAGAPNFGWIMLTPPGGDDSWQFDSSEGATVSNRPQLSVTFIPAAGCVDDPDCNDANLCTDDVCNGGTCEHTNNMDVCDDGVACTAGDVCSGGICGGVDSCFGGEVCNLQSGQCETPPQAPPLPIVAGDDWRYFKGTAAPPVTWNEISFVDAGWIEGTSGFGYGTDCDPYGTDLSDMPNGYRSIFTRRLFQINNPANVSELHLTLDFDDGFVAYINGVEVARNNIVGSPPAFDQLATADHECSGSATPNPPLTFALHNSFSLETLLVPGANVLAVQGHNTTDNSSDFTLLVTMDSVEGSVATPPTAVAVGSRYLEVSPPPGLSSVALQVGNPGLACLPRYVDATGFLVDAPVFQTSATWGTVLVTDREVIPSTPYDVRSDVRQPLDPPNLSAPASVSTWLWGDTNNSGDVDVFDIVCVLDGFQDVFTNCALEGDDLRGDVPNREIDVFDIVGVLDAFQGMPYPDADPCSGARALPPATSGVSGLKIQLVADKAVVVPGDSLRVDVFAENASFLKAYQLDLQVLGAERQGIKTLLVDETRADFIFAQTECFTAQNNRLGRFAVTQLGHEVGVDAPVYLGTFILRVPHQLERLDLRPGDGSSFVDLSGESVFATEVGTLTIQIDVREAEHGPERRKSRTANPRG